MQTRHRLQALASAARLRIRDAVAARSAADNGAGVAGQSGSGGGGGGGGAGGHGFVSYQWGTQVASSWGFLFFFRSCLTNGARR